MKNETKKGHVATVTSEKAQRTQKKASNAAASESSMKAELKNSEHGNEKPAR